MRYNGIMRQLQRNDGVGSGCNCVNCMIRLRAICQNHDRREAAAANPLQGALLHRRGMAQRLDDDEVAVNHSFAQ